MEPMVLNVRRAICIVSDLPLTEGCPTHVAMLGRRLWSVWKGEAIVTASVAVCGSELMWLSQNGRVGL